MNPHLDELITLVKHPAIQGRRGEWREGDCCYDPPTQSVGHYVGEYANSGGMAHTISYEHCLVYAKSMDKYIWVPKLSDPIQPERGLLGSFSGWPMLLWNGDEWCFRASTTGIFYTGPTPEIAVAKAIIAQRGGEK